MLLAVDLYEDFIDAESVAKISVFSLQPPGVHDPKLDTPETNCFSADNDASFSQEILDIAMAEIEAEVEPDSVSNDIGWGRRAGIGVVYMCSATDSSNSG